jgi:hypothetical protein
VQKVMFAALAPLAHAMGIEAPTHSSRSLVASELPRG